MWFDMRVADCSSVKEDKIAPMLMCFIYARRGFIPIAMHVSSTNFARWCHERKKNVKINMVSGGSRLTGRDGRV